MQGLYSPFGSLKQIYNKLFGASQKYIALWKVLEWANYAAGWRSQGTNLKLRLSFVPKAALESSALHSGV